MKSLGVELVINTIHRKLSKRRDKTVINSKENKVVKEKKISLLFRLPLNNEYPVKII